MKTLAQTFNDLNAIKAERSHSRIVVPNAQQSDDHLHLIRELLGDTGIDQAELAGLSLEVAAAGVNAIATVGAEIGAEELFALIGSLWRDGVILGVRYARQLYASDNGTRDSEATEASDPPQTRDRVREAANDDPRGERDR